MNISNKITQTFISEILDSGRYRKTRLHIKHTVTNILHPRVFIFMLVGITIIFLTFLTSNNAVEIAISGIASVFIGIGVNNYSMIENHLKEERRFKMKTGQTAHILRVTNSMIEDLHAEVHSLKGENINSEFEKIHRFIRLGIQLMEEDDYDNYPVHYN
jgi:hypothetical protein